MLTLVSAKKPACPWEEDLKDAERYYKRAFIAATYETDLLRKAIAIAERILELEKGNDAEPEGD